MNGRKLQLTPLIRRVFARAPSTSPWNSQEAVREELFGVERLEDHARSLAAAQPITSKPAKVLPLAWRLADNGAVLIHAYRTIVETINDGGSITPAAQWLIDNYHVVERQIRDIRSDLPPGYYRQLPKLAQGPFTGYPRVLGVAWAFVAHTDSRFDPEMLVRCVRAYQEVQPLTIGELWAVGITLRIVLVENLRRLAERIVHSRAARQEADNLADRLLGAGGCAAEPVAAALASRNRARLPDAFVVQLVHRLRDQDPRITPALTWLDQRLAAQGTTADAVVRDEHHRQGAASVTVRNIITSMRMISDVDWTELFERISLVDDVLAPSGFLEMDFPTRNLYRSAIEELARGSNRAEIDIARRAVLAAEQAACAGPGMVEGRRSDPGYHLLAEGRRVFEAQIGFRPPPHTWLKRWSRALGIGSYVSAVAVAAGVLLALPLFALASVGLPGPWLILLGAVGAIPAIDAAVALVNRGVTRGIGATLLPTLALRDGVPSHLRTLVAVPTLLTTREVIEEQIERLEIHYLASPEGGLHFAMVSDWVDAITEHAEGDAALLAAAAEGIARLNQRHGALPGGDRFLLFHRRRVGTKGKDVGSVGSASEVSCTS